MPRAPRGRPIVPHRRIDRQYFNLPRCNPSLNKETLFSEARMRIAWEFGKVYSLGRAKKKAVVFTTFLKWEIFHAWALRGLQPVGCRVVQEPPKGPMRHQRQKFKLDSDTANNDYDLVWKRLFPDIWIEKHNVKGQVLESVEPTTDISCIYDCKAQTLKVSFKYKVERHAALAVVDKKRHAPLASTAPKTMASQSSPRRSLVLPVKHTGRSLRPPPSPSMEDCM